MSRSILTTPLRGIIPPIITSLKSRDELDCAGLERLIDVYDNTAPLRKACAVSKGETV